MSRLSNKNYDLGARWSLRHFMLKLFCVNLKLHFFLVTVLGSWLQNNGLKNKIWCHTHVTQISYILFFCAWVMDGFWWIFTPLHTFSGFQCFHFHNELFSAISFETFPFIIICHTLSMTQHSRHNIYLSVRLSTFRHSCSDWSS